jgi:hypothetical protein
MVRRALNSLLLVVALAGCSESLPPFVERCVNDCVKNVVITPELSIVRPGDVIQFTAALETVGTVRPGVRWLSTENVLSIDSTGRARVLATGTGNVYATPIGDSLAFGYAVQLSVTGDTSVAPRASSWTVGHDSVQFDVVYLAGRKEASPVTRLDVVATGTKSVVIALPAAAAPGEPQRMRVALAAAQFSRGWNEVRFRLVFGDGHAIGNEGYVPIYLP